MKFLLSSFFYLVLGAIRISFYQVAIFLIYPLPRRFFDGLALRMLDDCAAIVKNFERIKAEFEAYKNKKYEI